MDPAKFKMGLPAFLAVFTCIGVFAIFYTVLFHEPPAGSKELIFTTFGILIGKWGSVMDYFFGSSSGSAAKSKAIENMAATTAGAQADAAPLKNTVEKAADKVVDAIEHQQDH